MTVEEQLKRNMLEFHCGHTLFCPCCGRVMDVKNAVAVDLYDDSAPGTPEEPKLYKSAVTCGGCYDKRAEMLKAWALKRGLRLDTTDGRSLWPQRKRR